MRVLIGCERSGIVRRAFSDQWHYAISCDTQAAEDGQHRSHWKMDVFKAMQPNCWDLIILHPPCQFLAVSGNAHHADTAQRAAAVKWTVSLFEAACRVSPRVALENPVGVLSSKWRKPSQYIQPYKFGEDASKKTGLWLYGLPKLRPTEYIDGSWACCGARLELDDKFSCPNCEGEKKAKRIWANQTPSGQNKLGPSPTRAIDRARTYQGIADAMANQWGIYND